MAFLNPWLLLGTLGVAVPIIIHLLNRYRHRQVDWGAMELLRRALVVRSRQVQIEDLMLLALRCLAVLLLALAIARPTITSGVFGKNAQAGVVIAIDGSYSMGHKPSVSSRFEMAIERVRDMLKTVNPGDPVTIVLMGNTPRVWQITYEEEKINDVLKKLTPLPEELNLELCLTDRFKGVRTMMFDMKAEREECYIISDSQEITWGRPSDATREALRDIASRGKVYFISTGTDNCENLGVTRFEIGGGEVRKGTMARYDAEVRNFGKFAAKGVTVDLMAGDARVDRRVIESLAGGESQVVPLFMRFDKAGTYRLKAHTGMDPLPIDNDRYAAVTVRDAIKVLLIDGRPSNQPYQSATAFLQTALSPKRGSSARDADSIITRTISWLELTGVKLTDFDVVIMAHVPNVREEDVPVLYSYVQQGGGLFVFLGKNVTPEVYNKRLVQKVTPEKSVPLLPGELKELVKPDAANPNGWPLEIAENHPLSRTISRLPKQLMDDARFQDYFRVAPAADARVILKMASDGSPLLSEKTIGQGKVLMFASSADREWSNFIIHPAGPMLLHDAITYLTAPPLDRPLKVGQTLVAPVPHQSTQTTAVWRDPAGIEKTVTVAEEDGRKVAKSEPTEAVGFYEVLMSGSAPQVAAVNVAPAEGEIRCVETAAMSVPLAGTNVRIMADGADIAAVIKEGRIGRELWCILMMLGLFALLVELYLARYFARRIARVETAETAAGKREQLLSEKA